MAELPVVTVTVTGRWLQMVCPTGRSFHTSVGSGVVALTEHLGSDSFLHVDAGEAGRLTVRAPGDDMRKPGDAVSLDFDKARIHRFDSQGKVLV